MPRETLPPPPAAALDSFSPIPATPGAAPALPAPPRAAREATGASDDLYILRILGRFLVETLANTGVFISLAGAAFSVDWVVRWFEDMGITHTVGVGLEGVALLLFGVDVLIFTSIQVRIVHRALKELLRL